MNKPRHMMEDSEYITNKQNQELQLSLKTIKLTINNSTTTVDFDCLGKCLHLANSSN